jgi:hypothetical protein
MKKALIKLLSYITKNSIPVVATKSGKGMKCYKLDQIASHVDTLKVLAEACNWQVEMLKGKYNSKTETMSPSLYYIGPNNEMDNDDIMALAEDA